MKNNIKCSECGLEFSYEKEDVKDGKVSCMNGHCRHLLSTPDSVEGPKRVLIGSWEVRSIFGLYDSEIISIGKAAEMINQVVKGEVSHEQLSADIKEFIKDAPTPPVKNAAREYARRNDFDGVFKTRHEMLQICFIEAVKWATPSIDILKNLIDKARMYNDGWVETDDEIINWFFTQQPQCTLQTPSPAREYKTADEILERLFYKPKMQDWYKLVLQAMKEYALQHHPVVQHTGGEAGMNEAVVIIQTLMAYGKIHTVKGVSYTDGSHEEVINKAEDWLHKYRSIDRENETVSYTLSEQPVTGREEGVKETIRKLNAPLLHFSTLDKTPTLELLDREGLIKHVVDLAKKYVLPIGSNPSPLQQSSNVAIYKDALNQICLQLDSSGYNMFKLNNIRAIIENVLLSEPSPSPIDQSSKVGEGMNWVKVTPDQQPNKHTKYFFKILNKHGQVAETYYGYFKDIVYTTLDIHYLDESTPPTKAKEYRYRG